MLFKFFLLALPILVQCAPQDNNMAKAAAAAAKGSNGKGSPNDNFDCICRPIPGNTNNEYSCKCRSSEAAPSIDQPNNQLPAGTSPPQVGTPPQPGNPPQPGTPPQPIGTPPQPGPGTPPPPVGTPPPDNGGGGGGPGGAVGKGGVGAGNGGAGGAGVNQNGGAGGGGANPAPAAQAADQGDPLDQPFGDTFTYVMCLKRAAGADIKTKPVWDWLARDSGNVKIKGKWMQYKCSYGATSPFFVLPAAYQKVLDLCKGLGYEDAQPADSIASNYYPFQIDQQLTEYFHQTSYAFSTTYDRYQQTTVDKC